MKMISFRSVRFPDRCLRECLVLLLFGFPAIQDVTGSEPPAANQAVNALFPDAPESSPPAPPAPLPATEITKLETRIDQIESRLGTSSRPASVAYNMERRLTDLERRIQQLEQKQSRLQQDVDQRLRRLEME